MTKKNFLLITAVIAMGGISLYINRDWFAGEDIHIMHRSMPQRAGAINRNRANTSAATPVLFGLNRKLALTEVRVIALSDEATNKYPHDLWHLVSDSNSVPIRSLYYGTPVRGMRPFFKGAQPDPLRPGEKYRLMLKAGSLKAEHEFEALPRSQ